MRRAFARPLANATLMIKNLRGQCRHCGGVFEFRADTVGTTGICPHCGQPTELILTTPTSESGVPKRTLLYIAAAVLILALGCAAILLLLQRARRLSEQKPTPRLGAPRNAAPAVPGR